ncbi:hypothetical protein FPV16_23045 [Methylobacterium sp. W2]|uniref:hypothetical protein n=1 Tax=Methylobacterium sp. W2 TaxID=2598107 RepID=UPI001D0CC3B6|nr:hypothetical protein [Methylobacterium sp. W2]MCC0809041.1 hypothetical protein [Methylobacterium sp. W2]
MALSQLSSSDAGADARNKINPAIAEADKVAGLAAVLAALQIRLAPYEDLVGSAPDRPGDAKTLFTRVMTGAPKLRPALDRGTIEDGGDLGQVLRISGADADPVSGYIDVAPRRAYYMRPGRAYLVQHYFKRAQNPSDPLQHAVELRFQNLSSTFGQVSNVRLGGIYQPTVQDGAFFVDTFIGKDGAPGAPSYIVPPTSAYGVPFFRIYGNGHQTDLGFLRLYDVSDALAGGADVASILARVKKLEDGQLAGVTFASSWADLASRVGKVVGAGATVPDSDTGTHTDPVTGTAATPNPGRYTWSVSPQGWQWVSVTDARQAADFVGSAATAMADPLVDDDGFLIWDASTQKIKKLLSPQFLAYIESISMGPKTYPSWPKIFGQAKSRVISLEDPERRNILLQAPEGADMAINFNYKKATFDPVGDDTVPSAILFNGDSAEYGDVGPGVISVALRPAEGKTASFPAPVFCRFDRLSVGFPTGQTYGDDVMARWPDEVHPLVRKQMRTSLNSLNTKGVLDVDGTGAVKFFMRATGSAKNDRINLANPDGKKVTYVPGSTGITYDPAGFIQGGGTNAFGNTGLLVDDLGFALDSQFMMLQPFDTTIDANGIGMGDSSVLYLTANRDNSRGAARSGPEVRNVLSLAGKSVALNRISATQFETFTGGVFDFVTSSTIATMPSGPLNVMATYASTSGFTAASPLKWRYFMAGRTLGARTTIAAIETEMAAINAVFSQVNGGV